MKVIWTKEKLQDACLSSERRRRAKSDEHYCDSSRRSSSNTLTDRRGFTNMILKQGSMSQTQNQSQEVHQPDLKLQMDFGQCRVCKRCSKLRSLDDENEGEPCSKLLEECFGLTVYGSSSKICEDCAGLIRSSNKFKQVLHSALSQGISAELSQSSIVELASVDESNMRARIRPVSRSQQIRRANAKRQLDIVKRTEKVFVACSVCGQKYPIVNSGDSSKFVCSRCKLRHGCSERTVSCVRCQALMPIQELREHLETHAQTDLKGRRRLLSLPKKPSKVQTNTAAASPKKNKSKLTCKRCRSQFTSGSTLEEHMKQAHGDHMGYGSGVCAVCFKDLKSARMLAKHMKIHEVTKLYECKVCGKIFKTIAAFQRHNRIHQNGGL